MPRAIRGFAASSLLIVLLVGCSSAPRDDDPSNMNAASGATPGAVDATDESDGGLFGWLGDLNPFRDESRSAVESGRVTERAEPDGTRQVSIDIDLSRGEGPRSLLCTVTRRIPANGDGESLDLLTLLVRDDPRRMMLFDESPAFLVVSRERHALTALPPSADSVKRASDELQARRTWRVPAGVLDRLTSGAPVQLVVVIGGSEVTRTIPGSVCVQIEGAGHQRSGTATASASRAR